MKLGLIAMSGVRAANAELMELGLTLPGFVERSRVIASLPSLSLLTLAGMTPADIHQEYIEIPNIADLDGLAGEYDAVAISSYTAQVKDAYTLADRYRRSGTRVILGGLHVSSCPEEASPHADALVLGEAEVVWPQVIADLKSGSLKPIYDARSHPFDLRNAPMPRYDLLDVSRYNRITVQTQRGCPFSCNFCASSIRISPLFKVKPVERVIAEVQRIKEIWPKPFIEFADDNSFANKRHAKRLARALAPQGVRWFTETDVSVADDDELLSMLRDAGCAQLLIGFEAPDAAALDGIETKTNWKSKRADGYLESIRRIQSKGIAVNGCFVLGLDGHDETCFEDVAKFVMQSGLRDVQVTVQTPFPGTPLYDRLQSQGRLIAVDSWEKCTLFDVNFIPAQMTIDQLQGGFRQLIEALYSDEATALRRSAFRQQMRQTMDLRPAR